MAVSLDHLKMERHSKTEHHCTEGSERGLSTIRVDFRRIKYFLVLTKFGYLICVKELLDSSLPILIK